MALSVNHPSLYFLALESPNFEHNRDIREALGSVLRESALPARKTEHFLLCVSEIYTNLVKHAGESCRSVSIELFEEGGGLSCHITDDAEPFTGFAAERALSLERAVEDGGQVAGMGLGLIARLFPDHDYTSRKTDEDHLNRFVMRYPPRPSLFARPKVMIVEDEISHRVLIRTVLEDHYQVSSFTNAEAALAAVSELNPDLILSDLSLPGVDGLSFRRELMRDEELDAISFVFLTGVEDQHIESEAGALGIDDFLNKPINLLRLKTVVDRITIRRRKLLDRVVSRFSRKITETAAPYVPPKLASFNTALYAFTPEVGGGDIVVSERLGAYQAVMVADVMGHGVQAKLYALTLISHFRTACKLFNGEELQAAKALISEVSQSFSSDSTLADIVATGVIAVVGDHGDIQLASAGHPMPALIAESRNRLIAVGGPLLGLPVRDEFEQVDLILSQGESLLLYTDGLYEVGQSTDQREAAAQSLIFALGGLFGKSCDAVKRKLSAVHRQMFSDGAGDDATLVVLQREDA
ncbi:MAG: SpoIIE family protein phosphatase [Rhodospirillaceae bacterium]